MTPITHIVCFAVRQVCGVAVENVAEAVEGYYRDHTESLPRVIQKAHERAWKALGVALAGDSWLDRVKLAVTASGDEKAFREQVRRFLAAGVLVLDGRDADQFRRDCLAELQLLLRDKAMVAGPSAAEVARGAADFRRFDRPQELVEQAGRVAGQVADVLEPRFGNLARLLRQPPPLLVTAFAFFFRREVLADEELRDTLLHDGVRGLFEAQQAGFRDLDKSLRELGDAFDDALDQAVAVLLERIEAARRAAEAAERQARLAAEQAAVAAVAAVGAERASRETHASVLGLTEELLRVEASSTAHLAALRELIGDVAVRLDRLGMRGGELRPHHSLSIRGEDEKRAVRQLLARFRELPEAERVHLPALLNGLGKLQVGAGDFANARQTFTDAARAAGDDAGRAEVSYNAYLTALEERKFGDALIALREAAALDPARFAPFPLHRYLPDRILGAGGFGAAVLCHDERFDEPVVIKVLLADDLDRAVTDVFREAQVLRRLDDPTVIRVRDCEYADPAARSRPYIVMEYFEGDTLAGYVREHGPMSPGDLLAVARAVAGGLARVHGRGVLHRDLKGDNLLVHRDGVGWRVKLIDFGLALRREVVETSVARGSSARTLRDASVAGTLKFAAPEQMGELPDVRVGTYSDVYGFGRTCYAALFGHPDPDDEDKASLPEGWRQLLSRCTAKRPDRRPQNFDEVLELLERIGAPAASRSAATSTSPPAGVADTASERVHSPAPPPPPAPPPAVPSLNRFACPQCHTLLKSKTPVSVDQRVKCPKCQTAFGPRYAVRLRDELKVYEAALTPERTAGVQLAPHAVEVAAVWAVLTRLEATGPGGPTAIQKLRLYDGQAVEGYTAADAGRLQRESPREGTFGVDPQYVVDRVADAVALTRKAGEDTVHPLAILGALGHGLEHAGAGVGGEQVERFRSLLDPARGEYERAVWDDAARAITADEDALARLCRNYSDNVRAYTQGEKVRNRYTGLDEEPDERLMRSVEERAEVSDDAKDEFRRVVMNCIGALAIEAIRLDYALLKNLDEPAGTAARTALNRPEWVAILIRFRKALEEKLVEDQKYTIKWITTPAGGTDRASQEKLDVVKGLLIRHCGHTDATATDALELAAAALSGGTPPDPDALLARARTHLAAGRVEAARAVAAAAVRLAPDRADAVAVRDQCGPGKPC